MSSDTLRLIVAGVLLVHGIGHILGVLAALGFSTMEKWSSQSWLLTGLLGETVSRVICFIMFLIAMVGFIVAALAVMGWLFPHEWWRPLSAISAVLSLLGLALFWNAFPALVPNKIGAIAVDIALLVGLLVVDWPTEAAIGF